MDGREIITGYYEKEVNNYDFIHIIAAHIDYFGNGHGDHACKRWRWIHCHLWRCDCILCDHCLYYESLYQEKKTEEELSPSGLFLFHFSLRIREKIKFYYGNGELDW